MTADNLLAYAAQVSLIVLACAGLPRLLRLRSPGVQYAFWRTTLAVCLVLPFAQPWKTHQMVFVPAPVQGAVVSPAPPDAKPPAGPDAVSAVDTVAAAGFVMLVGIAARLAWIGLGMIRLRRMRRLATDEAFGFDDLQQAIGTSAPILWSSEVRHPVTFGLFDPVVLLPIALKAAAPPAQRAVVAHELHHVKRRDWGWVVSEEVVRSIFWFHPAVWWLVSRVQLARETVVDELSIPPPTPRRTLSRHAAGVRRRQQRLASSARVFGPPSPATESCCCPRREKCHRSASLSARVCWTWRAPEPWRPSRRSRSTANSGAAAAARSRRGLHATIHRPLGSIFQFGDADLRICQMFATASGYSWRSTRRSGSRHHPAHDVPWDEALDLILRTNKLECTVEGARFTSPLFRSSAAHSRSRRKTSCARS
jgi:beta-lactamase regulating signal transducer with metallopeptidase domain